LTRKISAVKVLRRRTCDYLKDDVDELLAMGHCNCSKESIDSSSESSSSEETITIVEESEESDSDYAPCKADSKKENLSR
jgi:hypothetical protein